MRVLCLFQVLLCSSVFSFLVMQSSSQGKDRELVVLILLSSWCLVTVIVLPLFFKVSWVGLQSMIVVIPDHTHFLFLEMTLSNETLFQINLEVNIKQIHFQKSALPFIRLFVSNLSMNNI